MLLTEQLLTQQMVLLPIKPLSTFTPCSFSGSYGDSGHVSPHASQSQSSASLVACKCHQSFQLLEVSLDVESDAQVFSGSSSDQSGDSEPWDLFAPVMPSPQSLMAKLLKTTTLRSPQRLQCGDSKFNLELS